ncbi:MAG TPA: hypothetical protein VH092_15650 [Urbifossiella sp.]|nr:hypothetical protein [Urbifossiella sp.]
MRTWFWAAAALAVATVVPGVAAAQPAKAVEPTVEVRIRSLNDILDKATYVGGLFDQEDAVTQVRELVKLLSQEGKGIEGVDPARPLGGYAVLTPDVATSPAVLMVPVVDRARLLRALKERLGIEPEDAGKGVQKIFVPLISEVYLKFADDYVYAARDPKHLDEKYVVSPKTFFAAKDGAVVSVVARLDRVPADLRDLVTGQFEHQIKERRLQKADGKQPGELKLVGFAFDGIVGSAKTLVDEGKEFSVRVFVDEKADELAAELSLTAKPGTGLAKTLAGLKGRTSLPAGIVKAADPVFAASGKLALPDDFRKQLDPVLTKVFEELAAQAGDRAVAERVIEALAPTAKAAAADVAVAVSGPDAKGRHTLLLAAGVKGGKELEKLAKEFGPFVPADEGAFTFDVEKVGAFSVHKFELGKDEAEFDRIFGTKNIWLATSDDVIAVSIEPTGALLKAGLRARPAVVPVLGATVAAGRFVTLVERELKEDEVRAAARDAFGPAGPAGRDVVSLSVDGGDQLTARVTTRGRVLTYLKALDQLRRK